MAEFTTRIHGYSVYVDTDADGGGSSYCHVTLGRDCNSLELLQAMGRFDDSGREVPQATIDAIQAWADARGY